MLLIPGFLAGDGSLGLMTRLAALARLPHAERGHARQRGLLREAVTRLEARLERMTDVTAARERSSGRAAAGSSPGRWPCGGRTSSQGIVTLGAPVVREAQHASARARLGRRRRRLGHAARPAHVHLEVPEREVLPATSARARRPSSPTTSATSRIYSKKRRRRVLEGVPGPGRRPEHRRSTRPTAAWPSTPPSTRVVGRSLAGFAQADDAPAVDCRSG